LLRRHALTVAGGAFKALTDTFKALTDTFRVPDESVQQRSRLGFRPDARMGTSRATAARWIA